MSVSECSLTSHSLTCGYLMYIPMIDSARDLPVMSSFLPRYSLPVRLHRNSGRSDGNRFALSSSPATCVNDIEPVDVCPSLHAAMKRSLATVQTSLSSFRSTRSLCVFCRTYPAKLVNPTFNLSRPLSTTSTTFEKMRCVLIKDGKGPAENLYLGEEETPEPKQGEVLVKVKVGA